MERPGLEDDLVQGRLFTYPLHSILVSTQRCLPPEDVLDLFEEEELDKLVKRATHLEYLSDKYTPLYNLEDLASLTKSYLIYVEHNRESLNKTGYPQTCFDRSPD